VRTSGHLVTAGVLAMATLCADAEVERSVRIESKPSGARVTLLVGDRREPLGRTPLVHQAEFHSEQSVLRLELHRPDCEAQTVDLSASQALLQVSLPPRSLVAQPEGPTDGATLALHKRLASVLQRSLASGVELLINADADFTGAAKLRRHEGATLFEVGLQSTSPGLAADPVQSGWQSLVQPLLTHMLPLLRHQQGLDAVRVVLSLPFARHDFAVGATTVVGSESRCVGGTRQVYDNCASKDGRTGSFGRCLPGYRTVYDPCLTRQSVSTGQVVASPQASTTAGRASVEYSVVLAALPASLHLTLAQVEVRHVDARGKVIYQRSPKG